MSHHIVAAMAHLWQRIKGTRSSRYELLPITEKEPLESKYRKQNPSRLRRNALYLLVLAAVLICYGFF